MNEDKLKMLLNPYNRACNPKMPRGDFGGVETITTKEMWKHLGKVAFLAWVTYFHHRSEYGLRDEDIKSIYTAKVVSEKMSRMIYNWDGKRKRNPVIRDYAKGKKLPCINAMTIGKANRRLKKVGLVTYGNNGESFTIYGDFRDGQVFVPKGVAAKILALPAHGGRRKKKHVTVVSGNESRPVKSEAEQLAELETLVKGYKDSRGGVEKTPYTYPKPQKAVPEQPIECNLLSYIDTQLSKKNLDEETVSRGRGDAMTCTTKSSQEVGQVIEKDYLYKINNKKTRRSAEVLLGAVPQTPHDQLSGKDPNEAIPPFPGAVRFKPATTPHPPKIPPTASDEEKVMRCIKAYRSVIEHRTGTKCFDFCNGDIKVSKYYPLILSGAKVLMHYGHAPAAWAAFAMHFWDDYIKRKLPDGIKAGTKPPIAFVFGAKFIHKYEGLFRSRKTAYSGGRVCFPQIYKEVIERHNAIRMLLIQTKAKTYEDYVKVVETLFPGGWESWYEKVDRAIELDRRRMTSLLVSGLYLW